MKNTNYLEEAESDAKDFIKHFEDEIIEVIVSGGKISNDHNNDYNGGDSYFHESYIDKWYNLEDAAELLNDLSEFEEDDCGLWEGKNPKDAISTMAAFTYGHAVSNYLSDLVEKINNRIETSEDEVGEKKAKEIINNVLRLS